jgi:hypothetical protein
MSTASTIKPRKPIYVESRIRASIDEVWHATQDPDEDQAAEVLSGSLALSWRWRAEVLR